MNNKSESKRNRRAGENCNLMQKNHIMAQLLESVMNSSCPVVKMISINPMTYC